MIPTLVTDVQVHRSKTESNNGRPKNSENVMVAADVHINHHSQNETEVLKDRVISFSTLSYLDMGTKIKCVPIFKNKSMSILTFFRKAIKNT